MVTIKFFLDNHLHKTMSYFLKNNVSFLVKQRIISCKTTCRFLKNNVSFLTNALMQQNTQRHIINLIL